MIEDCLKLTSYFGERDRAPEGLLSDRLLDLYGEAGIATSMLVRGIEGFGRGHHWHTDRVLSLSEDLPLVATAVDRRERVESVLERVLELAPGGLVTLERARMLRGEIAARPMLQATGEELKLTVYLGRHRRIGGRAAYLSVSDLLRRGGLAGATVILGVDGTLGGRRARARFFGRNAEVPTMVVAVGGEEAVTRVLPQLGVLAADPLITLERVRVCKRDGQLLAGPPALPAADAHGLALWQKLTVYSSHAATHEGRPLHAGLVRRLLSSGAGGATSVSGIWGFHGDHAPHGDRLLQVRRHVPVVTVAIDSPERAARSFEIIDELTAERGLVTSEMVPALSVPGGGADAAPLRLARHRY